MLTYAEWKHSKLEETATENAEIDTLVQGAMNDIKKLMDDYMAKIPIAKPIRPVVAKLAPEQPQVKNWLGDKASALKQHASAYFNSPNNQERLNKLKGMWTNVKNRFWMNKEWLDLAHFVEHLVDDKELQDLFLVESSNQEYNALLQGIESRLKSLSDQLKEFATRPKDNPPVTAQAAMDIPEPVKQPEPTPEPEVKPQWTADKLFDMALPIARYPKKSLLRFLKQIGEDLDKAKMVLTAMVDNAHISLPKTQIQNLIKDAIETQNIRPLILAVKEAKTQVAEPEPSQPSVPDNPQEAIPVIKKKRKKPFQT